MTISAFQVLLLKELERTLATVSEAEIAVAQEMILAARRVFVTGAGRSGLALKMAAMRLMHLGLVVHVAGEVTTPAIGQGDLLLVASGSGTTAGAVHAAEVARNVRAEVLALTAAPASKLGQLAQGLIVIPAATKQDHAGVRSEQYAGALLEQSVLLVMDAIFQVMWRERGESAGAVETPRESGIMCSLCRTIRGLTSPVGVIADFSIPRNGVQNETAGCNRSTLDGGCAGVA